MAGQLVDQVVFITGGARGQGRAHAEAVAEQGAHVVLFDRCSDSPATSYGLASRSDLEHTAKLVQAQGREALTLVGDVRDPEDVDRAVAAALDRFGRIDVLLANAGIYGGGAMHEVDRSVWDEVIDVNLGGVFQALRAVTPHMVERGYGRIVATASMLGRSAISDAVPYVASKWGVVGLVKAAALDLAPFGITVNAVAPGNIATPMVQNDAMYRLFRPDLDSPAWGDVESLFQQFHVQPVALLDPVEISSAVLFLIGPGSQHITGSVIDVNAGASAKFTA
ncbi:mycofactocin-coupled SDR family oxidoreductase [Nocardia sp. CA2R105]|uniref:mycofactocin-coupled SDR family oxidoreductase n=1 Tax=Nocardia coffeae TaxID=2873381 RepID=UPI001CA77E4A|nr:mycofactocin-coupled SDR family oxidoreductase [Nocardia coffeae]MBY8856833.1 mycofactocin-coupled SDR family oxidoreductase [Nocardia coffeae]